MSNMAATSVLFDFKCSLIYVYFNFMLANICAKVKLHSMTELAASFAKVGRGNNFTLNL